jgi:acetolactate synthase regulatory subunit
MSRLAPTPRHACSVSTAPPKASRDRQRWLRIKAEQCTEVLPRVLNLVARYGLIPCSLFFEKRNDRLYFAIFIDELEAPAGERLLRNIEKIVRVISVSVGDDPGPFSVRFDKGDGKQ